MTEEREIPADVAAAALIAFGQTWAVEPEDQPLVDRIARAILAERERCAKVADKAGDTWSNSRDTSVCIQEAAVDAKCEEIARAIRSGQ